MKKTKHKITINDEKLTLYQGEYSEGRGIALELRDSQGDHYLTLTVNFPDVKFEPGEFAIKNWSENAIFIPAIFLSGLFVNTGKLVDSGFIKAPVWKFAK